MLIPRLCDGTNHWKSYGTLMCMWDFLGRVPGRSLNDVTPSRRRSLWDVCDFFWLNVRMAKQRRGASSVANRKLPGGVPTGELPPLPLPLSWGSEERGKAKPLVDLTCSRGSDHDR